VGLRAIVRRAATRVAPGWAERFAAWHLRRLAEKTRRRRARAAGADELVDVFLASRPFRVNQKRGEIIGLLNLLRQDPPRLVCEIGADLGGTLGLFAAVAAPDSRLLSLDVNYTPARLRALPHLARDGQQITCLAADSHSTHTLKAVRNWLAGRALDFLFIDGDHSLAGVASDFAMYAPLVRPGGLVALHDIIPDHRSRYGTATACDTGGVPIFWRELTARGDFVARELVENGEQDGYGLGVIRWKAARAA
jgi:predicted O-methyltransferase YrrM